MHGSSGAIATRLHKVRGGSATNAATYTLKFASLLALRCIIRIVLDAAVALYTATVTTFMYWATGTSALC